ncbi:hypothetical protein THAOC_14490 [Thalassiosira oceanica]|uniref:Uncharacterized protein n=1 Tax=Thalassiosira oceanica TaxID=159749 RepID=K0SII2_THAOC|nr:hypothetical protein THAOC_14490 [Thalassiosira oceanica]|eukprot:EJK64744.1 hypothetical protein THAOC_14490 [Thalassiosira oceanica]
MGQISAFFGASRYWSLIPPATVVEEAAASSNASRSLYLASLFDRTCLSTFSLSVRAAPSRLRRGRSPSSSRTCPGRPYDRPSPPFFALYFSSSLCCLLRGFLSASGEGEVASVREAGPVAGGCHGIDRVTAVVVFVGRVTTAPLGRRTLSPEFQPPRRLLVPSPGSPPSPTTGVRDRPSSSSE